MILAHIAGTTSVGCHEPGFYGSTVVGDTFLVDAVAEVLATHLGTITMVLSIPNQHAIRWWSGTPTIRRSTTDVMEELAIDEASIVDEVDAFDGFVRIWVLSGVWSPEDVLMEAVMSAPQRPPVPATPDDPIDDALRAMVRA